jgi:hypothetical protein
MAKKTPGVGESRMMVVSLAEQTRLLAARAKASMLSVLRRGEGSTSILPDGDD